jgi:hypothetical protein
MPDVVKSEIDRVEILIWFIYEQKVFSVSGRHRGEIQNAGDIYAIHPRERRVLAATQTKL